MTFLQHSDGTLDNERKGNTAMSSPGIDEVFEEFLVEKSDDEQVRWSARIDYYATRYPQLYPDQREPPGPREPPPANPFLFRWKIPTEKVRLAAEIVEEFSQTNPGRKRKYRLP